MCHRGQESQAFSACWELTSSARWSICNQWKSNWFCPAQLAQIQQSVCSHVQCAAMSLATLWRCTHGATEGERWNVRTSVMCRDSQWPMCLSRRIRAFASGRLNRAGERKWVVYLDSHTIAGNGSLLLMNVFLSLARLPCAERRRFFLLHFRVSAASARTHLYTTASSFIHFLPATDIARRTFSSPLLRLAGWLMRQGQSIGRHEKWRRNAAVIFPDAFIVSWQIHLLNDKHVLTLKHSVVDFWEKQCWFTWNKT